MTSFSADIQGAPYIFPHTDVVRLPQVNLGDPDMAKFDLFRDILDDMRPGGLVVDADQYRMLTASNGESPRFDARIIESPELKKGREASVNGVKFWQLTVSSPTGVGIPELVAGKPHIFQDSAEGLVHEWAANNFVNGIDEYQRTFPQLGAWRDENGIHNQITAYEMGVRSFDNVFWATGEAAERLTQSEVNESLWICLYGIGLVQGAGGAHGDARVKNLASDRRRVRFIDLEDMALLPRSGMKNDEGMTALEIIDDEIATFAGSCFEYPGTNDNVTAMVVRAMTSPEVREASYQSYRQAYRQGARSASNKRHGGAALKLSQLTGHFKKAIAAL